MSLLLAGLIVAGASGAVVVGRWLARRREDGEDASKETSREQDGGEDAKTADGSPGGAANAKPKRVPPKATATERLDGFPCQLGDVLMRMTGEEAWLAGGLVLSEEVPVAALFVAPDAGRDCAIYACPKPREAVSWLEPLDAGAVLVGGEPPSSVEHEGVRFDRVRRLPLRTRRVGVGAPDLGDSVVVAEYASAGAERLLVFKGSAGVTHAFRGVELEAAAYEVIPSGRSTLDEA